MADPRPEPLDDHALDGLWDGREVLQAGRARADAVVPVQRALVALFHSLRIDGDYGPRTQRAVQVAQAARGLATDGVVSRRTLQALAAAISSPPLQVLPTMPGIQYPAGPGEPVAGIYRFDRYPGYLALTFDDGPRAGRTDAVLDVLAAAGVRATFYVLGSRVSQAPDTLRAAVQAGHRVGLHSWDHPDFSKASDHEIRDQLERTAGVVRLTLGAVPTPYVRPPYGSPFYSDQPPLRDHWARVGRVLAAQGWMLTMWQVDSWDWKYPGDPHRAVQRFAEELDRAGGGAGLLHDIHSQAAEALPGILDLARQRGLAICDEDTLLALKYGGRGDAALT
ncbi:MAG: polysaccharide deacetylase family protein [Alphaproteobacteria bacterium]|nr:polysaccharide deacetylase family protein [Alphaproteobacteria bacterium]